MRTKKAAAGTAAGEKRLQNETYPKPAPLSSQKLLIGELLILLLTGNEQPDGWRQFERLLHQFYEGGVL
ncbi:MAG: hypothetical protein ACYS30_17465 [Planctomycetota bacterium]